MFRQTHAMIGLGMAGRMIAIAAAATVAIGMSAAHAQMIPSGPAPAAAAKGAPAKGVRKGQPAAAANADGDGQAKKDPAVALRSLETGIKSYEIGKLDPAVQSLTSALAGGLPSQQMARALYYRGLAFRKQAKPAQAISDLTSAIWLKGGLADAERASAIESRAAAYREAGLGEPAPVGDVTRTAAPVVATSTSAETKPSVPAANRQTATATAEPSSGGVGGFFSGLFGGGSAASTSAEAAPSTTASTAKTATPATATSSWGDATSVASSKGRTIAAGAAAIPAPPAAIPPAAASAPAVKVAAAAPVAAVPAAPAFKGKFRLQVAAVRSRTEAEALASKLKQAHGSAIGGREPAIEQSVIGAMGTFYRVRVGPYADANEPRQLCARIKPDGFDCLVVTQ